MADDKPNKFVPQNDSEKDLLKDLGDAKALNSLKNMDGGKILISSLEKNTVGEINTLTNGYKDLPEMELRARLAKLYNYIVLLRVLLRADSNQSVLETQLKSLIEQRNE